MLTRKRLSLFSMQKIRWIGLSLFAILCLFLPTYFFSLMSPSSAAAWYDELWQYRTRYQLSHSGTAINSERKVKIDVDTQTLVTASKMQSDCDDARFTAADGKLLEYFIDTNEGACNTNSTDFWVKLPTVIAGAQDLYMYYGNSTAANGRKNDFFADGTLGVGLKGYWKFDEASADTCADGANDSCDSALANDGTWNGNATTTTTSKLGGRAMTFDGNGDYVNILSNAAHNFGTTADFTLSAWIKTTTNNDGRIIGKWNDTHPGNAGYAMRVSNISRIQPVIDDGTTIAYSTNTSTYYDGSWHLLSITVDRDSSTGLKTYLDGALLSTTADPRTVGNIDNAFDVRIGNSQNNGYNFNGQIDDVRMYKRALSVSELTLLYNNGNGQEIQVPLTFTPSTGPTAASEEKSIAPVASWRFDEGYGQTAQDSSAQDSDATLGLDGNVSVDDPSWKNEDMCIGGKCLYFDGGDYLYRSVANYNNSDTSGTISLWFRSGSSNTDKVLVSSSDEASPNYKFQFYINDTNNDLVLYQINGDTDTIITTGVNITDNTWHHATLVSSGTAYSIYLDGKAQNLTVSAGTNNGDWFADTSNRDNIMIGARKISTGIDNIFTGYLDEVKIYNYARSAAQIKAEYAKGASSLGSSITNGKSLSDGLVGYWKMDESSNGSSAVSRIDSSGNGLTLTDNNTVASTTGKFGNAAQIVRTSSESLSINDSATISTGDIDFSFSGWVKATSIPTSLGILSQHTGTTSTGSYALWYSSSADGFVFRVSNGVTDTDLNYHTGNLAQNTWHFIVAWYDSVKDTLNLQVNNGRIDSLSYSGGINDGSVPLTIGRGLNLSWEGQIEEVRFYKRVLSQTERANLYDFAPSPVAHWTFDEGTGTSANDISGNGNTGTLTNGPIWENGKYGKVVKFDGSDDYINVGTNANLQLTGAMTASAWVKTSRLPVSNDRIITSGQTGSNYGYLLALDQATGYVQFGDSGGFVQTTSAVHDGQWHHLVGAHTGSNTLSGLSIYIDGRLMTTTQEGSFDGFSASSEPATIGADSNDGVIEKTFAGSIDDVRIYNYVRTPEQIIQDMSASSPSVTLGGESVDKAGPIAHYRFDEGADNTCSGGTNDVCNSGAGGLSFDGAITGATRTNAGRFSKAINFDGDTDYITIADQSSLRFSNAFTLSMWVKSHSTTQSQKYLIDKNNAYSIIYEYVDNALEFNAASYTGSNPRTGSSIPITDTNWHHIVYAYNGVNWVGYKDGIAMFNTQRTFALETTTANLTIGTSTLVPAGNDFAGIIDEVKLYQYGLTSDEVKTEFNQGSAMVLGDQAPQDSSSVPDQLSNGLVGWWKLDETATPALDSSGSGFSGTWTGNTYTVGKFSNAASFDGVDDYISVADNDALDVSATDNFTISAWVKPTEVDSISTIVNKGSYYHLHHLSTGVLRIWISDGTNTIAPQFNSLTVDSLWHQVTVSVDRNQSPSVKLYYDGKQQNCQGNCLLNMTSVGSLANSSSFTIGGNASSNYPFAGSIDDVRFYKRALTTREAEELYNHATGPVAEWTFDENTGTTTYDGTGNGNNGTLGAGTEGYRPAWKPGKYAGSLSFDGTDDYIEVADSPSLSITGNLTVESWVKYDAVPTATANYPIVGKISLSNREGYALFYTKNATPGFNMQICSASTCSISTSYNEAIVANTWYHVVGRYDGTNIYIYVNGQLRSTTPATTNATDGAGVLRVGYNVGNNYTNFSKLHIDTTRIFNYARTPSQIAYDFNQGAPLAHWRLDECQGTVANNSGSLGSSSNGTIAIGPTGEDTVGTCSTSSTAWGSGVNGKLNSSLSLDGTDDYVDVDYNATLNAAFNDTYSVSMWIKNTETIQDTWRHLFDKAYTSHVSPYYQFYMRIDVNNVLTASTYATNATGHLSAQSNTNAISTTNWQHVVATVDVTNGKLYLYLDGELVGSDVTPTGTYSNYNTGLRFGAMRNLNSATYNFTGQMDDVRLYNYPLSLSQVQSLYTDGAVKFSQ